MSPTSGVPHPAGDSRGRRQAGEITIAEAEARYHRDRLALYRARVLSSKPTSHGRLQELERKAEAAATRLRHARGR
jgi:hypothetical protein